MDEVRHIYRSRWHWYQTIAIPVGLLILALLQLGPSDLFVVGGPIVAAGFVAGLVLLRCRVVLDNTTLTITNPLTKRRVARGEVGAVDVRRTAFGNWYAEFDLRSGSTIRAVSLSRPSGFLVKPEGGLNRTVIALQQQLGVGGTSDDQRFPLSAP